jgi:hypothetical protein
MRTHQGQPLAIDGASLAVGRYHCQFAGQVPSRERPTVAHNLLRRTLGYNPAALRSSTWPQVHDPVGCVHGFSVVLDDQHRIAHIAQLLQRVQ